MAKAQTEALGIPIESMIAKANAQAFEKKQEQNNAPTPLELSRLEGMTREELVALVRRVCMAGWGDGSLNGADLLKAELMTDDESYDALLLRGKALALGAKAWNQFLSLATWWADRKRGKPAQSIALAVEVNPLSKMSTDRLLALEGAIAKLKGEDAIILPPEPERLSE